MFIAILFLMAKLLFWNYFSLGIAPIVVGLFFFSSVQMLFIGLLGEYVGAIYTRVRRMPLVVELERVNFDRVDEESIVRSAAPDVPPAAADDGVTSLR
ncbi:hypothetical protein [Xylophilus rhododendri]|uniref:hypothetical protein n=1 Tax=Xylophilus rhododendri TaxID=2697032 RepID=UPI001E32A7DC|nr:hypothetical protein [Xylophilus rhododendri]